MKKNFNVSYRSFKKKRTKIFRTARDSFARARAARRDKGAAAGGGRAITTVF